MEIPRAPGGGQTPPSTSEVGEEDNNFHEGIIGEFQQSSACQKLGDTRSFLSGGSVQDPAVHRWWVLPDYKWGAKKEKVPYGTVS